MFLVKNSRITKPTGIQIERDRWRSQQQDRSFTPCSSILTTTELRLDQGDPKIYSIEGWKTGP
jgi:hypothetical protein